MGCIKENEAPVFDREKVRRGDLIRAKHELWDDYKNGVIVGVTADEVIALYYTGYGNVSNHFSMLASEVSRGEWQGSITADMEVISDISDQKSDTTGGEVNDP